MKKQPIYTLMRFFILAFLAGIQWQAIRPVEARCRTTGKTIDTTAFVAPGDANISYIGRWNSDQPKQYTSYWGGAYFRVGFTGRHVKLQVGNKSNYFVKIDDGPWTGYPNATGQIDLTVTTLTNGKHVLTVAQGKDYQYEFKFEGLVLDAAAKTWKAPLSSNLIEWIGDSITTGYTDAQANVSDYAWICSENLQCEHTQIAYPGINLVSGYPANGMDKQYFKERSLAFPDAHEWRFDQYIPKLIVINLGTNDTNHQIPDSLFKATYIDMLTRIRAKFSAAEIFALKTFANTKGEATKAAVKFRNGAGDSKVHFVDTEGWLTAVSDFTDHTHPSVSGHLKVADKLAPIIAPFLK